MKIKGTKGGRRNRGDVIEYSTEEKIPLAVKDAVKEKNTKEEIYWAENIKVTDHSLSPKSPVDIKGKGQKFANNVYIASGEITVRPCKVINNKLRPTRKGKFKIQFEDVRDSMGVPDLKINKATFENIEFDQPTV